MAATIDTTMQNTLKSILAEIDALRTKVEALLTGTEAPAKPKAPAKTKKAPIEAKKVPKKELSLKATVKAALRDSETRSQSYYCLNRGTTLTRRSPAKDEYVFYEYGRLYICGKAGPKLSRAKADLGFPANLEPVKDPEKGGSCCR